MNSCAFTVQILLSIWVVTVSSGFVRNKKSICHRFEAPNFWYNIESYTFCTEDSNFIEPAFDRPKELCISFKHYYR